MIPFIISTISQNNKHLQGRSDLMCVLCRLMRFNRRQSTKKKNKKFSWLSFDAYNRWMKAHWDHRYFHHHRHQQQQQHWLILANSAVRATSTAIMSMLRHISIHILCKTEAKRRRKKSVEMKTISCIGIRRKTFDGICDLDGTQFCESKLFCFV